MGHDQWMTPIDAEVIILQVKVTTRHVLGHKYVSQTSLWYNELYRKNLFVYSRLKLYIHVYMKNQDTSVRMLIQDLSYYTILHRVLEWLVYITAKIQSCNNNFNCRLYDELRRIGHALFSEQHVPIKRWKERRRLSSVMFQLNNRLDFSESKNKFGLFTMLKL